MRTVRNYERFERHIRAWGARELESLLVLGRPGTGKSHAYQEELRGKPYHLFSARKTPIQVYLELYDNPGWPVVFDDVSALLRDHNFIDMLKALCETASRKVRWGTSTKLLGNRDTSFACQAPVLIVLNRLPEKHLDVMAILDRCDGIEFAPSKKEVIARMRLIWPSEGKLIDLMTELPVQPTLRTMVKARQWKRSKHLNLTEELLSECGVPDAVRTLINIMELEPRGKWRSRYVEATGLNERTYRRHKRIAAELLECGAPGHSDTGMRIRAGRRGDAENAVVGAA